MAASRPIIRYHGGKWRLADWIISHMGPHKVYVEPYGGAASVLLKKNPSFSEIYNDIDSEIVNLFQVVRNYGELLREKLYLTPFSRTEFERSYEVTNDPIEQARRTIIRASMGFSSALAHKTGFRNSSDSNRGTTPVMDFVSYQDALHGIIKRLRGVIIENRDAVEVMQAHDGPDTLHYVDPPYVRATRDYGEDYKYEITDDQHIELADVLKGLKGSVILSGYDSDLYQSLYEGWYRAEKATIADGAGKRLEVLWISKPAQATLFEYGHSVIMA